MSTLLKTHKLSYLTTCVIFAALSQPVLANEQQVDETIEVSTRKMQQAFPTREEAVAELKQVAGGTNLVELDLLPARQATLQDALGFEPGIMMQSFFGGNDQPRLNIRGSGVQSNPVNRGVQLLYDGLPLNQSDGSFVIGFLDPKSADMIAVYRGANGLRYGATTLGGAVNLLSNNGTNSQSLVRTESGSDGRLGIQGQLSDQGQSWDYYVSASRDEYDGYRHHSSSERSNINANFGFDISENVNNRTYVNVSDNYFEIPFVVPKARALQDPQLILGDGETPLDKLFNIYNRKPHRDSQLSRIANKTRISQGNSLHEVGLYAQQLEDTFTDPLKHNVTDSSDIGMEYAFNISGDYLTHHDDFLVSLSFNQSDMERDYHANNPVNGQKLPLFGSLALEASNTVLAVQWQAQVSENVQIVPSLQWVENNRDIKDNLGVLVSQNNDYSEVNPKIGINFQLSDDARVYANVSKTAEAPTYWELVSANVNPKDPQKSSIKLNDLDVQTSVTLEIGTSGESESMQWNIAAYHSDISDELISIVSDFAVNGQTNNYESGTIHQGVELELKNKLASEIFTQDDSINTKLVYNYSDFFFDGGEYEGNQIAGIPKHLIQFELAYQTDSGLYVAPAIRWQPDETAIDHANSQFQDDHLLVSLKLGYQFNDQLKLYADLQNITDEVYQTSYVIRGFSKAEQPSFLPGFGPSFSLGLSYQW